MVEAAQRLSLEEPEWLEVTLDQLAHLEDILTHDADNVTVLGMQNVKITLTLMFTSGLWIEADGAHRASR